MLQLNSARFRACTAVFAALCLWAPSAFTQAVAPKPPAKGDDEVATFRADTRLVILHASVVDKNGTPVPNVSRQSFKVFENGVPQEITTFKREDIPVSLGLIIDDSGSMKDIRAQVEAAALTLVKSSNPQDEVFVVNYNDVAYLDVPFTSEIKKLEEGAQRRDSRGGTAMRDALSMSIDYLLKESKKDKKVLLVVTDGADNSSSVTLERLVLQARQAEVLVYAIGLLTAEEKRDARRAKRSLDELVQATGGLAFYPKEASETEQIAKAVAAELRNQYVIGYNPTNPAMDGSFHRIEVKLEGVKGATVRTRNGYYATPDQKVPETSSIKKEGSGGKDPNR